MAQEFGHVAAVGLVDELSSMKFLSTWLRNADTASDGDTSPSLLNEVPEHMAQEFSSRVS